MFILLSEFFFCQINDNVIMMIIILVILGEFLYFV